MRPEILFPVNYLTTRVNKFSHGDWDKAFKILKYLNTESDLGLTLRIGSDPTVHVFADASFGTHSDRKSHSGSLVKFGDATVSAQSSKQKLVTKSVTEAELVCASDQCSRGFWVRDFLSDQGFKCGPVILHQDNKSTISMLSNNKPVSHKSRHIDVKYFYLRERIEMKEVALIHTATGDMIADILTKSLHGKLFLKLRQSLLN